MSMDPRIVVHNFRANVDNQRQWYSDAADVSLGLHPIQQEEFAGLRELPGKIGGPGGPKKTIDATDMTVEDRIRHLEEVNAALVHSAAVLQSFLDDSAKSDSGRSTPASGNDTGAEASYTVTPEMLAELFATMDAEKEDGVSGAGSALPTTPAATGLAVEGDSHAADEEKLFVDVETGTDPAMHLFNSELDETMGEAAVAAAADEGIFGLTRWFTAGNAITPEVLNLKGGPKKSIPPAGASEPRLLLRCVPLPFHPEEITQELVITGDTISLRGFDSHKVFSSIEVKDVNRVTLGMHHPMFKKVVHFGSTTGPSAGPPATVPVIDGPQIAVPDDVYTTPIARYYYRAVGILGDSNGSEKTMMFVVPKEADYLRVVGFFSTLFGPAVPQIRGLSHPFNPLRRRPVHADAMRVFARRSVDSSSTAETEAKKDPEMWQIPNPKNLPRPSVPVAFDGPAEISANFFPIINKLLPDEIEFCTTQHVNPVEYIAAREALVQDPLREWFCLLDAVSLQASTVDGVDLRRGMELVEFFLGQRWITEQEVIRVLPPPENANP